MASRDITASSTLSSSTPSPTPAALAPSINPPHNSQTTSATAPTSPTPTAVSSPNISVMKSPEMTFSSTLTSSISVASVIPTGLSSPHHNTPQTSSPVSLIPPYSSSHPAQGVSTSSSSEAEQSLSASPMSTVASIPPPETSGVYESDISYHPHQRPLYGWILPSILAFLFTLATVALILRQRRIKKREGKPPSHVIDLENSTSSLSFNKSVLDSFFSDSALVEEKPTKSNMNFQSHELTNSFTSQPPKRLDIPKKLITSTRAERSSRRRDSILPGLLWNQNNSPRLLSPCSTRRDSILPALLWNQNKSSHLMSPGSQGPVPMRSIPYIPQRTRQFL
ncbi:hypothetical protein O181_029483 [Austropuccinia psidii MF-1]|uniref:Uncharacterized protein n=1 Tax=Austropuccinia psidii MF-1 TaxID=1389203 RepID=A0A9Q3CTL6_9BASI|nr:hypothetical protein [Austropuccinia psidii MF-1]